jgi:rare lipoprotein A (peptidoglycan hydrolase)
MRPFAAAALIALALGPLASPARADSVDDAQARLDQAQQDLGRLRAQYSLLAGQARGAQGALDQALARVVNLERAIDDAQSATGDARRSVALRARRAYMEDPLGNLDAVLRLRDYAQIDAYLPYVTRPLEEDRRTVAVLEQRLATLRGLQADLDTARDSADRTTGSLTTLESRLTANLAAQQDKIVAAKRDLAAAQAAESLADPTGAGAVVADPLNVPPAPRTLPNGVELGPTAGVPNGMKLAGVHLSGVASWYGPGFHGHTTANGEIYDQYGFSAAHQTLPFGTVLLVSYHDRSVLVRINDRGPYVDGRFLDLSKGAADALEMGGLAYVDAEILVPA